MARILVVEDDELVRNLLVSTLQRAGHTIVSASDGLAGFAALEDWTCDLVLTDLDMPQMNGAAFVRSVRESGFKMPILVHTALPHELGELRSDDVQGLLQKPVKPADLVAWVTQALGLRSTPKLAERRLRESYGVPRATETPQEIINGLLGNPRSDGDDA